jgi:hypothetical protein
MRTNSRIRGQVLVLAALTVVVSLPELAKAQQTGLFPLAPIKRQRVRCDQEAPEYKLYKHKYFGYHPTCWRPFPTGWGCLSPEAPNKEESFKKIPIAGGETRGPVQPEGEEGAEGQPGVTRPTKPALPGGARSPSPFEMDDPAAPPTAPRPGQRQLPPPGDPFDIDRDTPATPKPGEARPAAPGAASNEPELSAPADQPSSPPGARTSQNDGPADPNDRDETDPVLALPSLNVPPLDDPRVPFGTQPPAANANLASNASAGANANSNDPSAAPAPRRSLISGFFSNLGLNWTRR